MTHQHALTLDIAQYDKGWTYRNAALCGFMLASTDAVAIIASM